MKIYLVLESVGQDKFTDKFGETAQPTMEIIGARRSKEAADRLKERSRLAALSSDDDDTAEKEDLGFSIVSVQLPDEE